MEMSKNEMVSRLASAEPDQIVAALRDSGHGQLADDWQDSCNAFEESMEERVTQVSGRSLQAYARMRLLWYRIQQVRDAAIEFLERRSRD